MSLVEASSGTQESFDRLAVVCFVPDPGHVIPLLKIAAHVRRTSDVLVVVPDELVDLVKGCGFKGLGAGPVRPESGRLELDRYIAASEWVRITSAHAASVDKYFGPLRAAIFQSLPRFREILSEYRPTCILSDDHPLCSREGKNVLRSFKVPVLLHLPSAHYRHHNTWSLRSCIWSGFGAAMRDVVQKTSNEFRLLAKRWFATRKQIDQPIEFDRMPPFRATRKGFTKLASGTSFLEAALLSEHLLYSGADHLVLPTMPPLETPLPHELQEWLDQSPDGGVVYVSFGTLVRPDAATISRIVQAVSNHGKSVLLQYSGQLPAMPGVRQEQWVPQARVLSHPAISLFITHGGAGSVEEALWYGKPMLCIPRVWDHYYASSIVSMLGAGVSLPRRSLRSRKRLAAKVQSALMSKHADNARLIAGMMRKHWLENESAVAGLFSPDPPQPQPQKARLRQERC
jgi:hypothetical protein